MRRVLWGGGAGPVHRGPKPRNYNRNTWPLKHPPKIDQAAVAAAARLDARLLCPAAPPGGFVCVVVVVAGQNNDIFRRGLQPGRPRTPGTRSEASSIRMHRGGGTTEIFLYGMPNMVAHGGSVRKLDLSNRDKHIQPSICNTQNTLYN